MDQVFFQAGEHKYPFGLTSPVMVIGTDDAVIPLTPAPLAGRVLPAFPEPLSSRRFGRAYPAPSYGACPAPESPRWATPALGPACSGGAAVLPWAREEPWAWRVRRRVGLGLCSRSGGTKMPCVLPIRDNVRAKTTLRPMCGTSSDFFGVVVLWDQNRS